MPLRRKSNGLLRTDDAIYRRRSVHVLKEDKVCKALFSRGEVCKACDAERGRMVSDLRVEKIGKRLDDRGDHTQSVI